ncbi:hypothetical protein QGP82_26590 [Leptothoe sp. LEGE 181152]|nr:hypothetical protein [Leptothoe sp. LEGE 181152]
MSQPRLVASRGFLLSSSDGRNLAAIVSTHRPIDSSTFDSG